MLYRIYNLFDSAYRVVSQPAVSAAALVPIWLASGLLTSNYTRPWSTVAHQFRKSPAVDNYAQPVDNTLLYHRVTD